MLGRAPRTVSRESARNMARGQPSRACTAQTLATARVRQPRRPRKLVDPWLWQDVRTHRAEGCSPEQIAGRLRRASPTTCGSTSRPRPSLGVCLCCHAEPCVAHCWRPCVRREGTPTSGAGNRSTRQIPHMTPMAERPAEGATRTGSGHGEGALITGACHGSAVGTLVEWTTRLVLLARRDGTDARRAREGFTKKLRHVPALLRKPRPYDRGKELAEHERLAQRLAIPIFVADPYSPWQRGTHEHTNGLLRQYLPQNTDVSGYTQRALHAIAHRLNPRP